MSVPVLSGVPGQARNHCSSTCYCGLRNYASDDVRPTDTLAVGIESQVIP